jgi:hypothetical protein
METATSDTFEEKAVQAIIEAINFAWQSLEEKGHYD